MIIDIKKIYPLISKELLADAITFTKQNIAIDKDDLTVIQHVRKPLLYNLETLWQQKKKNLFDVNIGAYDGAEVCELVGLFCFK